MTIADFRKQPMLCADLTAALRSSAAELAMGAIVAEVLTAVPTAETTEAAALFGARQRGRQDVLTWLRELQQPAHVPVTLPVFGELQDETPDPITPAATNLQPTP